jgi:tRNA nucleotidyltransferase (CCA-adding enzyme)
LLINLPAQVKEIIGRLEVAGYEGYIVGGCVRDSLMGEEPKDFDICTSALPNDIKAVFSEFRTIDTGIKHGTVTVLIDKIPFEITTYRVDGKYSDGRHPDSVEFTSDLNSDLSRRDFTVNAMAYNDKDGLIDPFGGQKDLFSRVLRCVGDPEDRFTEDGLRVMRALRFMSVLSFDPDPNTAASIYRCMDLLLNVSAERISNELSKLLCGRNVAKVLELYAEVFSVIIPEIIPMIGFDQHSRYHVYDVWKHTAVAVNASKPDKYIRLALLFHDIAKPSCFKTDAAGAGHFSGHEEIGAEMTDKILHKLKYDNHTIQTVKALVRNHYITPVAERTSIKRLLGEVGYDNWKLLAEVLRGDNIAKNSICFERLQTIEKMKAIADEIIENNECYTIGMLDIDGNKITEIGASGRDIRRILNTLLSEVISDLLPNSSSSLLKRAKEIYRGIQRDSVYYG